MYGKAFLMMLAAAACAHEGAAGSAAAPGVTCRSAANARAVAGLTPAQACALVRARADAALGGAGAGVAIELDLSRPHELVARVRKESGGAARDWPEIAVSVMDRPLRAADLERLGEAVARAVLND